MLGELLRIRMNSMGGKYVAAAPPTRVIKKTA